MSTPKEKILKTIRRHLPEAVALPDLQQDWISYADLQAQFATVLSSVGGQMIPVNSSEMLQESVSSLVDSLPAREVCSCVSELSLGNVDLNQVKDPHQLESLDLAILPGELAVAENAAIWIRGDSVKHRVIYFLPQHLALVVSASQLVAHMHAAYERLSLENLTFGCFISGPSKTADIEQSLVIGAHGARSLTVFLKEY